MRKRSADGIPDKRQAPEYLPYRIAVHYAEEHITNSSTIIPRLKDPSRGFQRAINYLESVLSVVRVNHNITVNTACATRNDQGQCTSVKPVSPLDQLAVPIEHLEPTMICDPTCHVVGGGVDADYLLYVVSVDDG